MEKLYKKDSKGKILEWCAEPVYGVAGVNIIIKYGELDGKIVTTLRANILGKNIGKSNETSPFTQAELEVESLYKRRKRQGYKSLVDLKYEGNDIFTGTSLKPFLESNLKFNTTDSDDNLKPMKCQQYYRSKKDWTDPYGKVWKDRKYFYLLNPSEPKEKGAIITKFPCLIQPKINGVRASISLDDNGIVQILSKEGLRYHLPHIEEIFQYNKAIFTPFDGEDTYKEIIFDGELYIYNEPLQVISSAVKKENLNTSRVKFLCFDLMTDSLSNLDRIKLLNKILLFTKERLDYAVEIVQTLHIGGDETVQFKTDSYIQRGFEGSILRDINALYAFGKRPMTITKLKRVIDEEFKIIDIVPQDKQPNLGLFVCRTKDGKEFKVTPTQDNTFKEIILFQKHLYVGKPLTCTFYEYTEDGIPFHVIDNIVRDYEK